MLTYAFPFFSDNVIVLASQTLILIGSTASLAGLIASLALPIRGILIIAIGTDLNALSAKQIIIIHAFSAVIRTAPAFLARRAAFQAMVILSVSAWETLLQALGRSFDGHFIVVGSSVLAFIQTERLSLIACLI